MLSPTNPALSAHARSAPPRAWLIAIAVCALPLMAAWWLTIRMSVDFYAADNSGDQMFFHIWRDFYDVGGDDGGDDVAFGFPRDITFCPLKSRMAKNRRFCFRLSERLAGFFFGGGGGTVVAYALGRLGRKLGLVIKHRARRAFGLCRCLSI